MCAGHSRHGLSDASGLKNPGEQAGGAGTESAQPAPSPSDSSSPSPWVPRQVTEPLRASLLIGKSDDILCGKRPAQAGAQEAPGQPTRKLCKPTRSGLLQEAPHPCAGHSRSASQLPAPQEAACLLSLLESVQASLAGPTWTTSCLGSDCLLPHLSLLTDHHPQPGPPAYQPGASGCQLCGGSRHPKAGLPSCPRAGPQHFLWICFQGPSHFLCSQGPPGSSSSFSGGRYGPSQAGEGLRNLIPEASSSRRPILPRPQSPSWPHSRKLPRH